MVHNRGPRPLPVSPGWHPYFRCPAARKARGHRATCAGLRPADQFDERPGVRFRPRGARSSGRARFELPGLGGLRLSFSPAMRHLQLWSQPGRDFVCLEPFFGPNDTVNTDRRMDVPPGQARDFWMRIEVEAMNEMDLAALRPLARRFASPDAALAEIARLCAELTLPKGAVHVVSDVHGEDVKLRHVVNNASGTLRPLVERLFGARMSKAELQEFLALIFYPREMLERLEPELGDPGPPAGLRAARPAGPVRRSCARWPRATRSRTWAACCPPSTRDLLRELLHEPPRARPEYVRALIEPLVRAGPRPAPRSA